MKKLLLILLTLAFALPVALAGEKTVTISRNEGIYDDGTGVYYCSKGGITMTFSSGLNNVNYLVEHQQVVFDIFSTNYVIKKIKFNCLDNTTDDNLDCFYWGPSTISEFTGAPYTPTGTYTYSGYVGTWVGGSTPSKYVKFVTEAKPVRFGSVEITYDKEFGDIYDLVTLNSEIENGQTYVLVSKYDSRALGKEEIHGSDPYSTFSSTPVTLLNFDSGQNNYMKVKVTDEVSLMKLESSGNSTRPWYIKIGDNYMRRRTGTLSGSGGPSNGQGFNLYTESSVPSDRQQYFRTSITVENNNNNALIRYEMFSSERPLGNETFAIRHYNGGDLFRVIDYNTSNNQYANNQRVYLYKPAQSVEVTTECNPTDGGYITLGGGVLTDNQGKNWSQHYDNVTFFVGAMDGYGIDQVTVTNLSTNEVTVLNPTSTSDFGNDYSFEMPAANVKVTATFVEPHVIHTVSNPTDGGGFNFLNGYTDFNGQTMSNEGKTVTFKPEPADDYIFTSVTYTDNVTGQTTTLTPDADGVYSFVMPGNDVTLTANFVAATELYLLGTANGKTGWEPKGPKFTYDADNEKYYIDVYFRGGNDDPYTDPAYGYFSLTKKIDENGNWGNINGYRLGAQYNNFWVEDGSTAQLYPNHNDDAFRIPPGVYRIEVDKDMQSIHIIKYELTMTFDPAGGSIVEPGQVVTATSNLDELVHAINPNEENALYYNTIDNWSHQENDNTAVINNEGYTTMIANANIGYIHIENQATYRIIGDLYLLGTANGKSAWFPYGPKFTYDANAGEYYIDVYFKGYNDDPNAEDGYGYFSLSTRIGSNDTDWGSINGYRIFAASHDYFVEDNENPYQNCFQRNNDQAFKIPAGVYRITVDVDMNWMKISEYPTTLTFNPASGATVAAGDQVNITSNLDQLVHAINPDEENATFKYATSTDGTLPTPNTEGSTVTITAVDATTTVNAQANIGYITATGNANYIIPAPPVYSITTVVTPEGAGAIDAPADAVVGSTVNFTVDTNEGYRLDQVQVTYGSNLAILDYTYNPETGVYTFVMPNDEVKIYADYSESYDITTIVPPEGAGVITVPADAFAGETVNFTVTANTGYLFDGVTVTYTDGSTGTITVTDNGNGSYSFTMPEKAVTIQADFTRCYNVETWCYPAAGGTITVNGVDMSQPILVTPGTEVVFTIETNPGYDFLEVVITNMSMLWEEQPTSLGNNQYSFVMPERDVVIAALFVQDLYMLGTANGETTRHTYGPKFNYDPDEQMYYLDVYFKGGYDDPDVNPAYGYFNLSTKIDMNDNWDNIAHNCLFAPANNYILPDDANGSYGYQLYSDAEHWNYTFKPEPAVYQIRVNRDMTHMYVTAIPLTISFDPESQSTVTSGTVVTVSSNLDDLVHAINPNEVDATFQVRENHGAPYNANTQPWVDGNTYTITEFGWTPFDAKAFIGYIDVHATARYFIETPPEPEEYNVSTVVLPDELSSHGSLYVLAAHITEGQTVVFTATCDNGYEIADLKVTKDTDGEVVEISQADYYYFVMPGCDVTIYLTIREKEMPPVGPTTLAYIERGDTFENYTEVVVADELIGVWMARNYLWAKDQAVSNYFLPQDEGAIDFMRERMKRDGIDWQPRDWDQSNWVILDFGQIPEFEGWDYLDIQEGVTYETNVKYQEMKAAMERFVDNKIKAGSINGVYICNGFSSNNPDYEGRPYTLKRNHVIILNEVPDCDNEPTGMVENSLGYPGYQEDPREEKYYPDPSRYMYNHYMPYNFLEENTVPEGISASQAAINYYNLNPNDRYFFMTPKDQEVAHVWAVWVGQKTFEDPLLPNNWMTEDVFATYRFSPADGVNKYGFNGAFYVTYENWDFNRLYVEDGSEFYGKPGVDNEAPELAVGEAYMFHIAIKYAYDDFVNPHAPLKPEVPKAPMAPMARTPEASNDAPGPYLVYPLDMMGTNQTITAVRELQSQDAVTIKSMTYYNMMGQASDTPFDGINVIVVRYSDGSSKSWKVLK